MIKNDIMEDVFQTLFNMDSVQFVKELEEHTNGDVSYLLQGLTADFTFGINETYDQNMTEPVEVTVKLIKQRKPEHTNIDFITPKVIL